MTGIEEEIENARGATPRFILGFSAFLVVVFAVVLGYVLSSGEEDSDLAVPIQDVSEEATVTVEEMPISTPETVENTSEEFWETGVVEILGDPIPANADIGYVAPTFKAQPNNSEQTITIDPSDGTVRLIGFFAHWCPHCQREVPRVSKWLAENNIPNGIEIIAVSTAVREGTPNYPPSAWFISENWPTQILVDSKDNELATGFGLGGFPYWILIDGTGTVIHRSSGELTKQQFGYLVELAVSIAPQIT